MTVTEVEYTRPVNTEQIKTEAKKRVGYFKADIVWFNAIGFLFMHLSAVYGLYLLFSGQAKFLTFVWTFYLMVVAGFSTTAGAHRLWSHRTYKAVRGLKFFLIIGQTIAGQNCLWVWVRDHRQHHKYSDTDADPHNASRGFFFSHIGWLMMRKHLDVIEKGKQIDMSDLNADPWVMFQKDHYKKLYFLLAVVMPIAVPCLLWEETIKNSIFVAYFVRFIVGVNFTWMVNSYAHFFGTKPYTKEILPVESPLVSFVGLGEGWHNYHHTFPWDYRAAELGRDLNFTTTLLDKMAEYGWVYDRRTATEDMVKHRVEKRGDGTHHKWGAEDSPQ